MIYLVVYLYIVGVFMAGIMVASVDKESFEVPSVFTAVVLWPVSVPAIMISSLFKE